MGDITEAKIDTFAAPLRSFLETYHPQALMFSGPMERTWPGIEALGANLLRRTLVLPDLPPDSDVAKREGIPNGARLVAVQNTTSPESSADVEPMSLLQQPEKVVKSNGSKRR